MANNFEKLEALFAVNESGGKILLPDKDLGKILSYTVSGAP
jgi:hypothetical protein